MTIVYYFCLGLTWFYKDNPELRVFQVEIPKLMYLSLFGTFFIGIGIKIWMKVKKRTSNSIDLDYLIGVSFIRVIIQVQSGETALTSFAAIIIIIAILKCHESRPNLIAYLLVYDLCYSVFLKNGLGESIQEM